MDTAYTRNDYYRAHLARDIRFDGKFFVAVKSTGIYCRPICPARKAKLQNLDFYKTAAQAEEAGFRPCMRCRPETAPGSPDWQGSSHTVKRAISILEKNDTDELTIETLAENLSVSERWLRELFNREVGVPPQRLLLDKKLSLARNLLDNSSQSITAIAFASGFNSIRRFNDAFKKRFNKSPSQLRNNVKKSTLHTLYLRYRPPLDWQRLMDFFKFREIDGNEIIEESSFEKLVIHDEQQVWMKASKTYEHQVKIEFRIEQPTQLLSFVTKIKHLFDLDADPMKIQQDLEHDTDLKPILKNYIGLRVPGCIDGFELAIRAIIGQKISVKAARTVLTRLVHICGRMQTLDRTLPLTHFFPTPQDILTADLSSIGLTQSKITSIKTLASLVNDDILSLDGTADYESTCQQLLSVKGIGPWTVNYIAMRALKDPNAFPESDLELQKQIKQYRLDPTKWIPWRAYAAILLFTRVGES